MNPIDHTTQPTELWRQGVETRMRVSARTGAHQLCVFEQYCDPGLGAPTHCHAVEEVLTVLAGEAEIWLDGTHHDLTANQSLIIPAGHWHGFRNSGAKVLHVQAILAAPVFEASYEDRTEITRRWSPLAD